MLRPWKIQAIESTSALSYRFYKNINNIIKMIFIQEEKLRIQEIKDQHDHAPSNE